MNYMSKIAEMLGVEMGEEFKIRFESGDITDDLYMLTPAGICIPALSTTVYDIFPRLLTGQIEIVRAPWKPKDGDHYWYVEYDEGCALCRTTWSDSSYDLALYKLGKLYRTKAEAEKHADEDAAYWESIREELDEG